MDRGGIAVVGAAPLELGGDAARTGRWLLEALAARGHTARFALVEDEEAFSRALAESEAICLLDPGPTHGELLQVARVAAAPVPVILAFTGYPFCAVATRRCDGCPLVRSCRETDRVAVYRRLAERADLVIYRSPEHRAASEEFVGAWPEKTIVAAAGEPALVDAIASAPVRPPGRRATGAPPGRVLLWTHHLGLGDTIELLSFARALVRAAEAVTWVVPDAHAPLLAGQVPLRLVVERDLDLATERAGHDLIVEVTIRAASAYAGDIADERWLQLALEWQPTPLGSMPESFLALLARAGIAAPPERPDLAVAPDALARVDALLEGAGLSPARDLLVAVHPGAGGPIKRWAPERFAALCHHLRDAHGARLVLVGGPGEDAILDRILVDTPVELVSRAAPLPEVAALLSRTTVCIANDSGLRHLADGVGTPTLGLFGATSERIWGSTHPQSRVARARDDAGRRSPHIGRLSVDDVARAFGQLLARVASEPPADPARLVRSASTIRRVSDADGALIWEVGTAGAHIRVDGPDPIGPVVDTCAAPVAWGELVRIHGDELAETLLATGFLVPAWTRPEAS